MTIVRCPRCRDEVSVPTGAGSGSLVRCPLCLEQYLLSEALSNAPPPLILLSRGAEPPLVVDEESGSAAEYRLSGGMPPEVFSSSAPTAATVVRPAIRGARPKRKEKNAVVELVKIVGGGVLGLAMGLLVLWWAGKDPFNAGPSVARYAPWIVPKQFHGNVSAAPAVVETPATTTRSKRSGAADNHADQSGAQSNGSVQPVPTFDLQPLPRPGDLQILDALDDLKRPADGERKAEIPLDEIKPKEEARRIPSRRSSDEESGRVELSSAALPDEPTAARPMPDLTDLLDILPFAPARSPEEQSLP